MLVREVSTFESSLGIEVLKEDNIFERAKNEQSSQISMLTPSLLTQLEPSRNRLEFAYTGEYAWYQEFNNDDYDNHALDGDAYLQLGRRVSFPINDTVQK